MQTDVIIVNEQCRLCHVEPTFVFSLERGGLIQINTIDGENYLLISQLRDLERYSRMYYDLSINMEGIDAIHHLLERVDHMKSEIHELKRRLKLYESADKEETIDEL